MDVASTDPTGTAVLYVITKAVWGGAQRYVYDLALAAQERGYTVTVACGTSGELTERLEKAGIPVIPIPGLERNIRFWGDLRAFFALWRLMLEERPDIVHTNSSKAGFIAAIAARFSGVRHIIFTSHGWAWNERRPVWQKRIFKAIQFVNALAAHRLIAVSEAVRRDASWMPLIGGRVSVIRHGVSPLPILPRSESRTVLAKILGDRIPRDAFWIGALAELHPTKGLDVLIRAFAKIQEMHPEAVLILIGAGQDRGRLVALAHMLRVDPYVHFAGHVGQAARFLPALDVLVQPSYSEALGYSLIEAGAAALPVIGTNVGGIPEIVEDGATGILVEPGDEGALAEALSWTIEHPQERVALGNSLQSRIQNDFSHERMLEDTFRLYS